MMAEAIELLLANEVLRKRLGENAFRNVQKRFDLERQEKLYLDRYQQILEGFECK